MEESSVTPNNWQAFLSIDVNQTELFRDDSKKPARKLLQHIALKSSAFTIAMYQVLSHVTTKKKTPAFFFAWRIL